jgi:hypothetical protein
VVNGYDVRRLRARRDQISGDASLTERNPELIARWIGANRARVEFNDVVTHIGGDGELNAMQSVLAALAACDIEVITLHAALLGIQIEDLSIEAHGHFNVLALWGFVDVPGAGYDRVSYTVRLHAPGATVQQLAHLRARCERSSPVGDTLSRRVQLALEFVTET